MEHPAEVEHAVASTGMIDLHALAQDPGAWIAVSFAIFVLLFARYVMPFITKGLDERSAKIREQLEQASRLREQAEEMLASYKAEQEAKIYEAKVIVEEAQRDASLLREQAAQELTQAIERRKQQALEKIARAEQDAIAFVRAQMVELATKATAELIREQLDNSKEDPAVTRAIAAVEKQIH